MSYFIDIESSAGTKYCAIEAATTFTYKNRLDLIGDGSFSMPAKHPKAQYIVEKRIARCWGIVNSVLTEMGAIIIDKIEKTVSGGVPMLNISGPSLMGELTYTSVRSLGIYETISSHRPASVTKTIGDIYNPGETITTELPLACDGDTGTNAAFQLFGDDSLCFLIIRAVQYDGRGNFVGIYFDLNAAHLNSQACTVKYQYWDGSGWADLVVLSDGTQAVSGKPFSGSGWVTWEDPEGQSVNTDSYGTNYIVRVRANDPASIDEVWIRDLLLLERVPTSTALALIMAYPSGWSLDTTLPGYGTTLEDEVYTQFNGENCFEALARIAKITGEHFRESPSRKVCWLRQAQTASGVRAVGGTGDPVDIDTISYLCQITSITETIESADLRTRIYPYGAGAGISRITLANLNTVSGQSYRAVPAGYTLNKGSNYLENDAAVASYGTIEVETQFTEVTAKDNSDAAKADASMALFDAAHNWLAQNCGVYTQYSVTVAGLKMALLPGNTIRVSFHGYCSDGTKWIDVEDDLTILETTTQIDDNGVRTVALTLATAAYWRITDSRWLVDNAIQSKTFQSNNMPVPIRNITADDYAAGTLFVVGGGGQMVPRPYSGNPGEGSLVGDYLSLYGGTMLGSALLQATAAQGNNLVAALNVATDDIIWAAISKGGSNLTDLATRQHAGLTDIGANDHHNQAHVITGADHSVTGSALDLIGLSGTDTLGVLTPAYDVSDGHSHILRSNAGALTLATLTTNTLNIGADVQLTRSAANVLALAAGDSFQHADYAMDSGGVRITDSGHGYFRYLYTSELHAKAFIADLEQALAGGQIIGKSVAPLAVDFTCPAAGATASLVVQEFQGFGGARVFVDGDMVRIRQFSRPEYVEMISNPSFETAGGGGADVLANWTEDIQDTGTITHTSTAGQVHSGTYAAGITGGTSGNTRIYQNNTVVPGVSYYLSFWTRGDGTKDGRWGVYDNTNAADIRAIANTGATGSTYAYVAYIFEAPAGCTSVGVYFHAQASGTAIYDDVSMIPMSQLLVADCWGTVAYSTRDATAQTQTYTFTRSAGSNAGDVPSTTVIGKGTIVLDYGVSGNGYIESVAQSGNFASGVPFQQIVTWATHPASGLTVRTRIGNLNGTYGITDDYFGIGLGDYAGGNYLRYETNGGFLLKAGGGSVSINPDGITITDKGYLNWKDGSTIRGVVDFWVNSAPDWNATFGLTAESGGLATVSFYATATGGNTNTLSFNNADEMFWDGGLNIGSATGAGVGYIHASGGMSLGEFTGSDIVGTLALSGNYAGLEIWRRDLNSKPGSLVAGDSYAWYSADGSTLALATDVTGNILTVSKAGALWVADNCSALSFTDRTPFYEGNALAEITAIKGNGKGEIDHSTLPRFAQRTLWNKDVMEEGRDLGAMISIHTVALQQVAERLEKLEAKK